MSYSDVKSISMLLKDGNLTGYVYITDSSWNQGELYSAPKESAEELFKNIDSDKFGVYLLLSDDTIYIGQTSNISARIKNHLADSGKNWMKKIVVLTTSDNSFNSAHLIYLEASLIKRAKMKNILYLDNRTDGNKHNISQFDKVKLDRYIEGALFLLELINIKAFCDTKKDASKAVEKTSVEVEYISNNGAEITDKNVAINFLERNNIRICKNVSYAKYQEDNKIFWVNPPLHVLESDWNLILNNQITRELFLFYIPNKTISLKNNEFSGFLVRPDRPGKINLKINCETFTDTKSKINITPYMIRHIKY